MRINDTVILSEPASSKVSGGVGIIFTLQFFCAIAFSMVFSLLVLYLLFELHLPQNEAYELVAAYNALGYASSILGGYLGERFLGYRFAVIVSAVLGSIGLGILTVENTFALHLGLACFSMAYGMMIPAIFVLLGRLHPVTDHTRRDHGFILVYIAMDAGAFLAAISSGYISTYLNYSFAFAIGAICFLVTLGIFLWYQKAFVSSTQQHYKRYYFKKKGHSRWCGIALTMLCLPVLLVLLDHASLCNTLLIFLGVGCVAFIIYIAYQQKGTYSRSLLIFLVLLIVSTVFDTSYFLSPSAITMFTDSNVDKHIFGISIPTATYSALNPLFVIIIGPIMSRVWITLNKRDRMPSFPVRFSIGIILMGCGYLILMFGAGHYNEQDYVSAWWLAGGFLFQTIGELFISPAGYSMVGILVPVSLEGIMMGISQFSTGVAGALSSFLANWISPATENISKAATNLWYQHAFGYLGVISLIIGLLIFCLAPYLMVRKTEQPQNVITKFKGDYVA